MAQVWVPQKLAGQDNWERSDLWFRWATLYSQNARSKIWWSNRTFCYGPKASRLHSLCCYHTFRLDCVLGEKPWAFEDSDLQSWLQTFHLRWPSHPLHPLGRAITTAMAPKTPVNRLLRSSSAFESLSRSPLCGLVLLQQSSLARVCQIHPYTLWIRLLKVHSLISELHEQKVWSGNGWAARIPALEVRFSKAWSFLWSRYSIGLASWLLSASWAWAAPCIESIFVQDT